MAEKLNVSIRVAQVLQNAITYSAVTSIRHDQYGRRWRTELNSTEPAGPPHDHAATAAKGE
jgi:hypothetical protein